MREPLQTWKRALTSQKNWGTLPACQSESCSWATHATEIKSLQTRYKCRDEAVPVVLEQRSLGAYLTFTRRKAKSRIKHTWPQTKATLLRIGATKLPLEVRAILVGSMALPKPLYGCAVSPPPKKEMRALRGAVGRAVWGQANRWRAAEIVFTLLCKGHVVDPLQAFAHNTVLTARRVLQRRPQLQPTFERILTFRKEEGQSALPGPVAALLKAADIRNLTCWTGRTLNYLDDKDLLEVQEIQWLNCDAGQFLTLIRSHFGSSVSFGSSWAH